MCRSSTNTAAPSSSAWLCYILLTSHQHNLDFMQDFSFNQATPIQQAQRAARKEEKRQRILLDQLLDQEELVEQRWPFKSVRGKV